MFPQPRGDLPKPLYVRKFGQWIVISAHSAFHKLFRVSFRTFGSQIIDLFGQRAKQLGSGLFILDVTFDDPLPIIGFQVPILMEVRPKEMR
ncbi:hypothetical protein AU184_14065 [Mycolicibacterium novocastrense]|nr:hypothetical protein AU183_10380 [Mycolicibacterium novocastrense]KUH78107.1 hypothetical protein AU072_09145 [Mycolicibacterium novocastrense]KUH79442.1 hypothetical protein AU184_14065 [Mycolicibacterium novocastrense]